MTKTFEQIEKMSDAEQAAYFNRPSTEEERAEWARQDAHSVAYAATMEADAAARDWTMTADEEDDLMQLLSS